VVAVLVLACGAAMAAWFVQEGTRRGGYASPTTMAAIGFGVGAVGGLLLAFFGWAAKRAFGPEPERLALAPGETILFDRGAIHNRFLGGDSGVLTFTTRRLLFHPRKLSVNQDPRAIDLARVQAADLFSFYQIRITLGPKEAVFFTVPDRADMGSLLRQLAAAPEEERAAVVAAWREAPPS